MLSSNTLTLLHCNQSSPARFVLFVPAIRLKVESSVTFVPSHLVECETITFVPSHLVECETITFVPFD